MSFLRKMLGSLLGKKGDRLDYRGIPTVQFDPKQVTREVKDEIRATIADLPEIPTQLRGYVYDVALSSVRDGRDLGALTKALIEAGVSGLGRAEASRISIVISNRATSLMRRRREINLGITEGKWLHSKVPCFIKPGGVIEPGFETQSEEHEAADGKRFDLREGMLLAGKPAWPGREYGCRCTWTPVIPGFD